MAIERHTGAPRHRRHILPETAQLSPWPCLALIRANLTPAQEASAIARRKAIYEELHPETKAGVAGAHAANRAQGRDAADNLSVVFAAATSQATGKDERTIRRAAARGEKLGDDLKAGRPPGA